MKNITEKNKLIAPILYKKNCFTAKSKSIFSLSLMLGITLHLPSFATTELQEKNYYPYHNEAQSLMLSSPMETHFPHEYIASSLEIDKIKEQLKEKTQELEQYKTQIFRSSHPKDLAKLSELNKQIAQNDKARQQLLNEIKTLESSLNLANQRITALEMSTLPLNSNNDQEALQNEKAELAKQLVQNEEALHEATLMFQQQVHQNLVELSDLNTQLSEKETVIAQLKDKKEALTAGHLSQDTSKEDFSSTNFQKTIDEHLSKLADLNNELAAKETRISQLIAEKDLLTAQQVVENHVHKDTYNKDRKSALIASLPEKKSLNQNIEENEELKNLLAHETQAHVRLKMDQEELEKLISDQDHLNKQLTLSLQEKDQSLLSLQLDSDRTIIEKMNEIEALKTSLAEKIKSLDRLNSSHEDLSKELLNTHESLLKISQDYSEKQKDHDNLVKHFVEAQQIIANQDYFQNFLNLSMQEKEQELLSLKLHSERSFAEKTAELENLKFALENNIESLALLQVNHHDLNEQLSEKKLALSKENESHLKIKKDCDELVQDLSKAQQLIQDMDSLQKLQTLSIHEKEQLLLAKTIDSDRAILKTTAEIDNFKASLAHNIEFLDHLQQNYNDLNKKLFQTDQALTILNEAHLKREAEYNALVQDFTKSQKTITDQDKTQNALTLSLEEKEQVLSALKVAQKTTLLEKNNEIQNLEMTLNELQLSHDDLNNQMVHANEMMANQAFFQQTLIASIKEKEEAFLATNLDKERAILERDNEINKIQLALNELELSQDDLHNQIVYANQTIAKEALAQKTLNSSLKEKEEALLTVSLNKKQMINEIQNLKQSLTHQTTDLDLLNTDHEALTSQLLQAHQTLSKLEIEQLRMNIALQEKEQALIMASLNSKKSLDEKDNALVVIKKSQEQQNQEYALLQEAHDNLMSIHLLAQKSLANNTLEKQIHKDEILSHLDHIQHLEIGLNHLSTENQKVKTESASSKYYISNLMAANEQNNTDLNLIKEKNATETKKIKEALEQERMNLASMKAEFDKLNVAYKEKSLRYNELEKSLNSLSLITNNQDKVLTEANTTFLLAQKYQNKLEVENADLKNRMEFLEKGKMGEGENNTSLSKLSPALLKLLRPL